MKKQIIKDILGILDDIEQIESNLFRQGIKNVILNNVYYSGCELASYITCKKNLTNHDLLAYTIWLDRVNYLHESINYDIELKKIENLF